TAPTPEGWRPPTVRGRRRRSRGGGRATASPRVAPEPRRVHPYRPALPELPVEALGERHARELVAHAPPRADRHRQRAAVRHAIDLEVAIRHVADAKRQQPEHRRLESVVIHPRERRKRLLASLV